MSKMFQTLRDLLLDRLEQIEKIPSAMVSDTKLGKYLLLAGELLEPDELTELYQLIGLSEAQRNKFVSNFTLTTLKSLYRS